MKAIDAKKELSKYADRDRVQTLQRFFKTGKGEYAEGDIFIGVYVPQIRKVAGEYAGLELLEISKLLKSKIHEERLLALLILVLKAKKGSDEVKNEILDFYLSHTKYINNWDLVDLSCREIVGDYAYNHNNKILSDLANSSDLWERRISMVSTYAYIIKGDSKQTLRIAKILIKDRHDLIQKAVGWMLREVGKRNGRDIEREFLDRNITQMGRVATRYALEHFEKAERDKYLSLNSNLLTKTKDN